MTALSSLRRVSAALVLVALALLVVTGWSLMASYVPSDAEAFSSVVYLRQQTDGGAWARSLHYHAAALAVSAGFLFLAATYLRGRHSTDREAWWSASGAYLLLLGICFTGYLLPMDQRAYWGTVVRLGIVETIPGVGAALAGLLRGGAVSNASTLPRFYALHVAVLPTLTLLALVPLLRRVARHLEGAGARRRWLLFALVAVVLAYLVAAAVPAPLEVRADPADSEYVPRPEWYFLWLFQLGKVCERLPWIQSLVVPLLGCGLLLALPLLRRQRFGGRLALVGGWCLAWLVLTGLARWADRELPPKLPYEQAMRLQAEKHYQGLCLECHGEGGRGDGPQSRALGLDSRDFTAVEVWRESSDGALRRSIRDGKGKDMPGFGRQLSAEEIDAVLRHIKNAFAPEGL